MKKKIRSGRPSEDIEYLGLHHKNCKSITMVLRRSFPSTNAKRLAGLRGRNTMNYRQSWTK